MEGNNLVKDFLNFEFVLRILSLGCLEKELEENFAFLDILRVNIIKEIKLTYNSTELCILA